MHPKRIFFTRIILVLSYLLMVGNYEVVYIFTGFINTVTMMGFKTTVMEIATGISEFGVCW